mmetsp:Transcript_8110/g.12036  ORF Transcript_8110/g.12036 Transcript_8110/m.12036 type:complete len:84 (+) Transcript_8110:968-1219(+)
MRGDGVTMICARYHGGQKVPVREAGFVLNFATNALRQTRMHGKRVSAQSYVKRSIIGVLNLLPNCSNGIGRIGRNEVEASADR